MKYSGQSDAQLWIISTRVNSALSILAISFTALLAMSAVLATCFFVRRHQIRRDRARMPAARESHGMSSQLVKAMPSLIFTKVQEDNCTSSTCAICLEDYNVGEKIRVLPCRHSMFFSHLKIKAILLLALLPPFWCISPPRILSQILTLNLTKTNISYMKQIAYRWICI
jgi:hypothetical protein